MGGFDVLTFSLPPRFERDVDIILVFTNFDTSWRDDRR